MLVGLAGELLRAAAWHPPRSHRYESALRKQHVGYEFESCFGCLYGRALRCRGKVRCDALRALRGGRRVSLPRAPVPRKQLFSVQYHFHNWSVHPGMLDQLARPLSSAASRALPILAACLQITPSCANITAPITILTARMVGLCLPRMTHTRTTRVRTARVPLAGTALTAAVRSFPSPWPM